MPSRTLLTAGLEVTLNQYLRLDPETLPKLAALEGKVIAVELRGLNINLYLRPGTNGINIAENSAGEPDVLIRGTPLALSRLARGSKTVGTEVDIEGDPQLGRAFQEVLASIDIDWEEHVSRLLGDGAAHQVGSLVRHSLAWGQRTLSTLLQDATEYLQEERRDLPPRGAMERFLDAVDALRNDTERLEARIRRLQREAGRNDT